MNRWAHVVGARFGVWAAAAVAAMALAAPTAARAAIYIGPAASEGQAVTTGAGTQSDSANLLTYAFTSTGWTYSAVQATRVRITEVNFFADEGPGNLYPFVAAYNGGDFALGASYTVLAKGDPIAVTGGTRGPTTPNVRENRQFLVGGVNPEIDLPAGTVLVSGFHQSTRIVVLSATPAGDKADYINNGNSIPASVGQTLTDNNDYASFKRAMRFNIGLEVVPEPSGVAVGLLGLAGVAMRRRRNAQPQRGGTIVA